MQQVPGFAFDVEFLLLARKFGQTDLPVEWHNAEGSKVQLVHDSWRMARDAWKLRGLDEERVAMKNKTGR